MPLAFKRRTNTLVLIVAAFTAMTGATAAQTFCTKPIKPFCIEQNTTYTDERSRTDCRAEVDEFVAKTTAYGDCLRQQVKEAASEAETLRARFECKVRGDRNCPEAEVGS